MTTDQETWERLMGRWAALDSRSRNIVIGGLATTAADVLTEALARAEELARLFARDETEAGVARDAR